jgi:antirestriction protein ArdC
LTSRADAQRFFSLDKPPSERSADVSQTLTRADRLRAAHEKLQEAVESIVTGEDWQRMLKTAAKFHRYSSQNQLLIFLQRPDATLLAGFRKWQELGRFVKKGEKGNAIFAPCKYRTRIEDEDGEEKTLQQVRGFRVVHVFDICQTEGDDLADLDAVRPKLLDGDAPEGIWKALVDHAASIGFDVTRNRRGSENGYCDFLNKQIGVRPDASPAQAVKTLIHELGHALLHGEGQVASREVAEVEVESVAFIACDALGLDSGDYSFPYVTRWAEGSRELVKETAERAIGCAKEILKSLEVSSSAA